MPAVEACQILIKGIVQGVGFRPHVFRVASELGIKGWVLNSAAGVIIEAEADPEILDAFHRRLQAELPPLAVIEEYTITEIPARGLADFAISHSTGGASPEVLISPDIAVCPDCRQEVRDVRDRRFGYAFTNCTNCGPRFTIIKDVPYDRLNTTMDDFPMCSHCQAEYDDPRHRRFHAQPNACPVCGPQLVVVDSSGKPVDITPEQVLLAGQVLAVKGLGGFHMAVDALNRDAVTRLRQRKQRDAKPFAVMAKDMATVNKYCQVSSSEAKWLTSPQAPIVVLERYSDDILPDEAIHPGVNTLGVMLPYTPLHYLLFTDKVELLVMTSANISDEPLIIDNKEALTQLAGIADYFLLHNREIFNACDDSVIRVSVDDTPQFYRRARGFVPRAVKLPFQLKSVLATGGEMKNTFCLTRQQYAFLSQHQGDIDHFHNYVRYQEAIPRFMKMVNVTPQVIAHDLHPGYQTTIWAQDQELPRIAVQHHYAHMAAAMADNGLEGEVLALICDGTGYGTDGAIWGCEIFSGTYQDFIRQGHLQYVPLPGGDISILRPYRMAMVYLREALGDEALMLAGRYLPLLKDLELDLLCQQVAKGINTVATSSCGRLFDAVSALLGVCPVSQYEGQAAIELEFFMSKHDVTGYPCTVQQDNGQWIMNVLPMWQNMAADLKSGLPRPIIAARFHRGLSAMLVDTVSRVAEATGLDRVVLSGGTFYNQFLLNRIKQDLEACGYTVYHHQQVPCGDGGLSLGQAIIASEVSD